MLTANAKLYVASGSPAPFCGNLDQLPDAINVEADKRIAREDAFFDILGQEPASIVAGHAQSRLGQVIGPKTEKLAMFGAFSISSRE